MSEHVFTTVYTVKWGGWCDVKLYYIMYNYMYIYIKFCSKNDVWLVFIKSTLKQIWDTFFERFLTINYYKSTVRFTFNGIKLL